MVLKPWREIAIPHEDVLKGTFQQSEFAADLTMVHEGNATPAYQDPVLFFQRTYITEGMRLLLDSIVKRLCGKGGDPVIQLQTAFGGGKTHTMLAVYHMAKSEVPASALAGIPAILDAAGIVDLPKAGVVVLDGTNFSPNQAKERGTIKVNTLWGELAWQLGGEDAYYRIKDSDQSGTSPGKDILIKLLSDYSPCIILIDELVAYIRQFEEGHSYSGGTFDSNISFIQALSESVKSVPTAVMLASLPESAKEAGSARGVHTLNTLAHYLQRVQAIWKPVATEEAFEIVRRRLFDKIENQSVVDSVCREFADFYISNNTEFPRDTHESHYFQRLRQAYPIHPEIFDRLYKDWSSLDNFQRTRGVLRFMAKVIHRLWKDDNKDALIMPGNIPLYDVDTRNEAIIYLPQGWDPILESEIDGERAVTTNIENEETRFGSLQACRRTARAIFLGSAPSSPNQMVKGIESTRIVLGCSQPGQQIGVFKDALKRLNDRLHYLNSGDDRFWFDTRPNLRREMEDRKRRFNLQEEVYPSIKDSINSILAVGVFTGKHVFTASSDVPDDKGLRLVVLPPDTPYSKSGFNQAQVKAEEILNNRGAQSRQKRNRLIFLAADQESVARLEDQAKTLLAWKSIVSDVKDAKLNLDKLQINQAEKNVSQSDAALTRLIRETYKCLLVPIQNATQGKDLPEIKWERLPLSSSGSNWTNEIGRVLNDNELLVSEWAPVHLRNILQNWFWKDDMSEVGAFNVWEKTCDYIYLQRLKDDNVYRETLSAGSKSRDFFGFAQGKEDDKYLGFTFGNGAPPILDNSLLLIEPTVAAAYDDKLKAEEEAHKSLVASSNSPNTTSLKNNDVSGQGATGLYSNAGSQSTTVKTKYSFFGTVELKPITAKVDFATVVDEVILQFTQKAGVDVTITVDITASSTNGFDENLQRNVKENCVALKFKNGEFE